MGLIDETSGRHELTRMTSNESLRPNRFELIRKTSSESFRTNRFELTRKGSNESVRSNRFELIRKTSSESLRSNTFDFIRKLSSESLRSSRDPIPYDDAGVSVLHDHRTYIATERNRDTEEGIDQSYFRNS